MNVYWIPPTDNDCNIISYTLKWTNSKTHVEQQTTVTSPPYNINGLTPCTTYTITVIARTAKGFGPSNSVTMSTWVNSK